MPIVSSDGKTFASEFERAVDDVVALYPGFKPYKDFRESSSFEDRREETYDGKSEPVTQDIVDQTEGKFINPAAPIDHPIAQQLGVDVLNRQILDVESKPPKVRDDLGELIRDLQKKHPEHFPPKKTRNRRFAP